MGKNIWIKKNWQSKLEQSCHLPLNQQSKNPNQNSQQGYLICIIKYSNFKPQHKFCCAF